MQLLAARKVVSPSARIALRAMTPLMASEWHDAAQALPAKISALGCKSLVVALKAKDADKWRRTIFSLEGAGNRCEVIQGSAVTKDSQRLPLHLLLRWLQALKS
jgi:hypothetical protein